MRKTERTFVPMCTVLGKPTNFPKLCKSILIGKTVTIFKDCANCFNNILNKHNICWNPKQTLPNIRHNKIIFMYIFLISYNVINHLYRWDLIQSIIILELALQWLISTNYVTKMNEVNCWAVHTVLFK